MMKQPDALPMRDDILQHWIDQTHSRDGYQRELAIRTLGQWRQVAALPALLERVNDWVPQVRLAALNALKALLTTANLDELILALPQLMQLRNRTRNDNEYIVSRYLEFLSLPVHADRILAAARSGQPNVSRFTLSMAHEAGMLSDSEMVSLSLQHPYVCLKYRALTLIRCLHGDAYYQALHDAMASRFMPVRREGFQLLCLVERDGGKAIARSLLFDASQAIRSIAIRTLVNLGEQVEPIYASVFAEQNVSPARLRCAITGVAELSARQYIPTLTAFLQAETPSIRRAALQSLSRFLPEDAARDLYLSGMTDPSPAVAKEAIRLMVSRKLFPVRESLLSLLDNRSPSELQRRIVNLACHLNKWDRLIILLHLYRHAPLLSPVLDIEFSHWNLTFNYQQSPPSSNQLSSIETLLRSGCLASHQAQMDVLTFSLKAFGLVMEPAR